MTSQLKPYDHQSFEPRWLDQWESMGLFQGSATQDTNKESLYLLFAFAYPSGQGLHVGHVESKTALDITARFNRMNGKAVFFPVGWDAFGLPAENYAIKTGVPPAETTKNAINTFRRQIKRLAISYDWECEVATSHPEYYKWTQWIFSQLYKKDLAYQGTGMVNWCPSCQTVLANEQVVNGLCERCDTEVVQKDMKQWFFKITKYKDELIDGLETVDWPKATKEQQINWIGRKEGINIIYAVDGREETITCFTTRPDTNFGATFLVLAPEHPFSKSIAKENQEVKAYLEKAGKKTERERQQEGRTKTGVFSGEYAINNLNGKKMPIWISDFVLGGFGTGAVVGVPGHDLRDFEFAKTFGIEVIRVVVSSNGDTSEITNADQVQEEEGTMVNSEFLNGLSVLEAKDAIMDYLEDKGWGKRVTSYKLRDWLISRQRYWGVPIPVVYDPDGNPHLVKEEHLPWTLPTDVDFKPTGESPLRSSKEFHERVEKLYGKGWTPEYDTMDTFVDSSWYYLRYVDARNQDEFASSAQLKRWLPVDFYMIGPEHIVLHLLYSRFFTKFLRDEGYLSIDEPFSKMRHQGMILGPDNKKMSKSKGNVINPDDVIEKFGADTLRLYEMFMGPIESDKPWDVSAVAGVFRFLQRVHHSVLTAMEAGARQGVDGSSQENADQGDAGALQVVERKLHQTLKKVTTDIPAMKFNTAIAALMEFMNVWEKTAREQNVVLGHENLRVVSQMIAPFAPFLAEELYQKLQNPSGKDVFESVHVSAWPAWDPEMITEDFVNIAVQINGKVRAQLSIPSDQAQDKEAIIKKAIEHPDVQKWLSGQAPKKSIYIPGKIVSLVI